MIWVISDTHLTKSHILPETFVRRVDREDIIFHLGDMVSFEIMEFLHTLCPVEAVRGNCDMPDVRRGLSSKKIIELNGRKIGLIHGQGGQLQTLQMVRAGVCRQSRYRFVRAYPRTIYGSRKRYSLF